MSCCRSWSVRGTAGTRAASGKEALSGVDNSKSRPTGRRKCLLHDGAGPCRPGYRPGWQGELSGGRVSSRSNRRSWRAANDTRGYGSNRAPVDHRAIVAATVGRSFPWPRSGATYTASRGARAARDNRFAEVRVAEDVEHENGVVFSPGLRDRAERARDGLFRQLCNVPGPATIEAIRRIGSIPGIPIRPDTIEALYRERAAADSEETPWPPGTAYMLEHAAETPPHTAEELQAMGVSRLADLAHDLRHGDFTLGTLIKRLESENEVQRWVASELRNRQGQAYSLEREPHVADEKEPDIRLRSR